MRNTASLNLRQLLGRPSFYLIVAAALFSTMLACKKKEAESKPIVTVQTAVVQKTDLVQTVESEAILYPVSQAAITPKVSAPVKRFYVNRGNHVKEGQLLAVLENSDLSAAAIENRGGLEQAQAAYSNATRSSLPEEWKKAELDASAAAQTLEAQQKLYFSREELFKQGALPRKELDQAGLALTQAREINSSPRKRNCNLLAASSWARRRNCITRRYAVPSAALSPIDRFMLAKPQPLAFRCS